MTEFSAASRVYVDSNIFVYFMEKSPTFAAKIDQLFAEMNEAGAQLVSSELAFAECLYSPCQLKNSELIETYEELFSEEGDVELLALDGALVKEAAYRGGQFGLKLLDAVHYLSALEAGCDLFVSADKRFKDHANMKVLVVS